MTSRRPRASSSLNALRRESFWPAPEPAASGRDLVIRALRPPTPAAQRVGPPPWPLLAAAWGQANREQPRPTDRANGRMAGCLRRECVLAKIKTARRGTTALTLRQQSACQAHQRADSWRVTRRVQGEGPAPEKPAVANPSTRMRGGTRHRIHAGLSSLANTTPGSLAYRGRGRAPLPPAVTTTAQRPRNKHHPGPPAAPRQRGAPAVVAQARSRDTPQATGRGDAGPIP